MFDKLGEEKFSGLGDCSIVCFMRGLLHRRLTVLLETLSPRYGTLLTCCREDRTCGCCLADLQEELQCHSDLPNKSCPFPEFVVAEVLLPSCQSCRQHLKFIVLPQWIYRKGGFFLFLLAEKTEVAILQPWSPFPEFIIAKVLLSPLLLKFRWILTIAPVTPSCCLYHSLAHLLATTLRWRMERSRSKDSSPLWNFAR